MSQFNETAETAVAATPLSGWRALSRVLTDPVETFKRLGAQPPVAPAYIVQMIVGAVVFALSLKFTIAAFDQQLALAASQPNAQATPPELMGWIKWGSIAFYGVIAVAGPWLVGMILSFIMTFFGQFQGGGVPLKAYLGMIGYARMPLMISSLIGGIYMGATGKALDLSLGILLSPEASPWLKGLLSMLNPFGLWYYGLLATGFAALFGQPPRKGVTMAVVLFLLGTLVTIGLTAVAPQNAALQ